MTSCVPNGGLDQQPPAIMLALLCLLEQKLFTLTSLSYMVIEKTDQRDTYFKENGKRIHVFVESSNIPECLVCKKKYVKSPVLPSSLALVGV